MPTNRRRWTGCVLLGLLAVLWVQVHAGDVLPRAVTPPAVMAAPAGGPAARRLGTDFSNVPGEPPLPAPNTTAADGQKAPPNLAQAGAIAPGSVPPLPGAAGPPGPLQEWHGTLETGVGTHNTWNTGLWLESHVVPDKVFLGLGVAVGRGWWNWGPWGWERDSWNRTERDRWRSGP